MFFECFRGQLFENGKRNTKSETTIQKALEERIPNHILHVQFERKISVSQSKELGRFIIQICPTYDNEKCSRRILSKINIYCQNIILTI